jgi:hypothetical protein
MKNGLLAVSAAVMGALSANAFAAAIPDNFALPPGFLTFGDAQSYSLQIACTQGNFSPPSSCPYDVHSSPGNLQDLLVVMSGSNNTVGANSLYQGIDLNYISPNNEGGKIYYQQGSAANGTSIPIVNPFPTLGGPLTYTIPDQPNGAGALGTTTGFVDRENTWDVSLGTLRTFLTGNGTTTYGDPVFFFNNNQQGSLGTADEDLAIWAKVWVSDQFGNPVAFDANGLNGYDLTNHLSPYGTFPSGGGVPFGSVAGYISPIDPITGQPRIVNFTGSTDYVKSGGAICFDQLGAQPGFGDIPVPCSGPSDYQVSNNLGANQAAYAVVFPELNSLLAFLYATFGNNPAYSLHVDVRMGCEPDRAPDAASCTSFSLNNGYEQLFIGRLATATLVPEPGTLLLLGLGLAAIGWQVRTRRS